MSIKTAFILFLFSFFVNFKLQADDAIGILQKLQRLESGYRVLYIAAHPDDENTKLISWLTHVKKVDCAYLSLTRGEGGQNLIGSEQGDAMGLIRTQELLAARKIDGATQFFTRARDFGFCKSSNEALEKWNEQALLEDIVGVIRTYRPDIIITRFSPEVDPKHPTHGHHTASARLAQKAFKLSADKTAFPYQLGNTKTWQAQQLWVNSEKIARLMKSQIEAATEMSLKPFIKINIAPYVPLLGLNCVDIAAKSYSMHKSQGAGTIFNFDDQFEYLEYLDGTSPKKELFEGLKSIYERFPKGKKLQAEIHKITQNFDPHQPWKSAQILQKLSKELQSYEKLDPRLDPNTATQLATICAGIQIKAISLDPTLSPGETAKITLTISNPGNSPLKHFKIQMPTGEIKTIPYINAGIQREVNLHWIIPQNTSLSTPHWLTQPHSDSFYQGLESIFLGENTTPSPNATLTCRWELAGQNVTKDISAEYHDFDPIKGKTIRTLAIVPRAFLAFDHANYLVSAGRSANIQIQVKSNTAIKSASLRLGLPEGFKSEPASLPIFDLEENKNYTFNFLVTANQNALNGKITASLQEAQHISSHFSQEINYQHIPFQYLFTPASAQLISSPVLCKAQKVAYIAGAGDLTKQAIQQLGVQVTSVPTNALMSFDYKNYDAVILGVRAYNTVTEIDHLLPTLFAYVHNGGNLIVQYNTLSNLRTEKTGPVPFKLSQQRVTNENAPPQFIDSKSLVLNHPNKIEQTDFQGWVQERGLYFASQWHPAYQTPLAMADKGEDALKGSLLVLAHGKGHFVYTGLSFFRQLPAGVPGAYKLMANLLSLGSENL